VEDEVIDGFFCAVAKKLRKNKSISIMEQKITRHTNAIQRAGMEMKR
jgi:hypothetical protein